LLLVKARWFGWLRVVWADGGYAGKLLDWFTSLRVGRKARLEIVSRSAANGFEVLPHRWIVERTFAWLSRYRRLARDYEVKTSHSEAFIYIAACSLMSRRLASSKP
jgi:putative transposase